MVFITVVESVYIAVGLIPYIQQTTFRSLKVKQDSIRHTWNGIQDNKDRTFAPTRSVFPVPYEQNV
jgi:hypothetical protein